MICGCLAAMSFDPFPPSSPILFPFPLLVNVLKTVRVQKKAYPDHIVTEVRQYTQSPMQTEYAIAGVSDKQRMISVFEIGVFCDRTVLADTCYLQKTMLNHNSRITESFLLISGVTITHLFANFNPVVQNNRNILTHLEFFHCRNIRGFFCNLTPD